MIFNADYSVPMSVLYSGNTKPYSDCQSGEHVFGNHTRSYPPCEFAYILSACPAHYSRETARYGGKPRAVTLHLTPDISLNIHTK